MKRQKPAESAKAYEPTPAERDLAEAHLARRCRSPAASGMRVTVKKGSSEIAVDHPDPVLGQALVMESIATADIHFYDGLMSQLANAGSQGRQADPRGINFMLSVVKGIEPRDQVEAMLASQMAAVHMATMTFARRLAHTETIPQQDSAERTFNKLARTFTTQVKALKRYRTSGQQTVRVERVTVNEGGQAIVGNVSHPGGGALPKTEDQPHAPEPRSIAHEPGTAMPSAIEAEREAVPITGGAR